jgi:Ca2+-binding EF-hand superfamily protein
MGNAKSSSASIQCTPSPSDNTNNANGNGNNPVEDVSLAMMAVARNCFLEKAQIISLRNAMTGFSDAFGMIKREGFDQALDLANLSNVEIFDLLFTMWDNKGDDRVSSKEFCIGISPLACPSDNTPTIINFALQVSDDLNRGYIEIQELHELLTGKLVSYYCTVRYLCCLRV